MLSFCTFQLVPISRPNQQRWCAKWKLSWNKYILHACFCTFVMLSWCLVTKISASELSQNFILRVRCWLGTFFFKKNCNFFLLLLGTERDQKKSLLIRTRKKRCRSFFLFILSLFFLCRYFFPQFFSSDVLI